MLPASQHLKGSSKVSKAAVEKKRKRGAASAAFALLLY
jgi:hypothetical protein